MVHGKESEDHRRDRTPDCPSDNITPPRTVLTERTNLANYILEVQRTGNDPAEVLAVIKNNGGVPTAVPPRRRLRGIAISGVFATLAAARQAGAALASRTIETLILPEKLSVAKVDAGGPFYVTAYGQTGDAIIAVFAANRGDFVLIHTGKTVSGIFASGPDAAAVADQLNRQGIEVMVFSRREARLAKEAKKQRVTEGPSPN